MKKRLLIIMFFLLICIAWVMYCLCFSRVKSLGSNGVVYKDQIYVAREECVYYDKRYFSNNTPVIISRKYSWYCPLYNRRVFVANKKNNPEKIVFWSGHHIIFFREDIDYENILMKLELHSENELGKYSLNELVGEEIQLSIINYDHYHLEYLVLKSLDDCCYPRYIITIEIIKYCDDYVVIRRTPNISYYRPTALLLQLINDFIE